MNKLVSRNPVQRFKEGRKIIKAQGGLKTVQNAIGSGINSILGGLFGIRNNKYNNYSSLPEKRRDEIVSKYLTDVTSTVDDNGNLIKSKIQPIKETPINDKTKKAISAPKNNPPIASGFIKGYQNTDDIQNVINQYGGIKGFQQFLIDNKFLSGDRSKKEGADGWWGGNTQKAYEAWKASLGSSPEVTNYVASQVPDALKPQQDLSNSGSLPTIKEQMQALTNNYTQTPEQKATSNWLQLDKSGTRNWMKNTLNLSPYKYTGALRAGVRRIAGGLGTEEDKNLILQNPEVYEALKKAGYWRFKQGGNLLPSKNIIERFKVTKAQKGLKTAPKAEKRFRKNSYNTTKEGNRETTTITSQTFGYNRNWPYFRQPATIQRIIEGGDTAFVETPEHHIFTKVQPRTALKSGNVYVEYNPKYDKNYSLYGQANTIFNYPTTSQEYETLKRRFNTAWNLAK